MSSLFALTFMIWGAIAALVTALMGWAWNKSVNTIASIGMFILFYTISWLFLPPIAIDMIDSWLMLLVVTTLAAILTSLASTRADRSPAIVPLGLCAAMLVGLFLTSGVFNARSMAEVITVVNHGQKDTAMELASQEQAQRVTVKLAHKRAAELLGSAQQPGLGSVAEYGDMYGNVTAEGTAIWVAPLQHTTCFRWLANGTTPGYFKVSHVNVMESALVEDQPIAYGSSGFYFGNDLSRHLYINGYVNYNYGSPFFQIDDAGVPHYIVPMERPQVGFYSNFPEKWAVVNATTGEITDIESHEELPAWIDRAYPITIVENRLADWGCYSQGPWACYISGVEVVEPTPGMVVTMSVDNEMIYYTGTQFHNNKVDGATSGVATINARTGAVDFYRRSGITEKAAIAIMDGAVANYTGRTAESPVLIQVNGLETHFSVITDASGAKKGFGMVWQRNRDAYGTGDTVSEALRAYLRSVSNIKAMTSLEGNSEIEPIVFEGLVVAITPFNRDGETAFYLRIDTVADKVFVVNTARPAEVATTNPGDPVGLTTFNAEPSTIEVDEFDNLSFDLADSEIQMRLTENTKFVLKRHQERVQRNNAKARLSELSPGQVRRLLEALEE